MMPILAATILTATATATGTAAGSLDLQAQIVKGRFLQILLVAHAPAVLVTPRTTLGYYVDVEIRDLDGRHIGRFGPRASCSIPGEAEYRVFSSDSDFGAQLFGVEIDILAPGRIRLASLGWEVGELEPGRDYRLVVSYHNDDARYLGAQAKRFLQRRYGRSPAGAVNLTSKPVTFRRP